MIYLSKGEDIGRIHAIPLTDEWLKRAGFELYQDDKDRYYHFEGFKLWQHENELFYHINSELLIYPDYVHQLQNLFFALTGSELKIKL